MKVRRLTKDFLSERLNKLLYDSRPAVLAVTRVVMTLATLSGLVLLVYMYGYNPHGKNLHHALAGIDVIFTVFVVSYLVRLLYAFRRMEYLRSTRFEAVLMAILTLNGIINLLLGNFLLVALYRWLGLESYDLFYEELVGLVLFFILMFELGRLGISLVKVSINPALLFLLSFLLIIGLGTGLLLLPSMTATPGRMTFIDALFTSVSASCVTGLIVVDTATYFTFRGQMVILILIQTGGLGIITFATFFASFLQAGTSFRQRDLVPDFLDTETISSARALLRQIFFLTFFIELLSFLLIYFTWNGFDFRSTGQKIFYSAFHAISAFCNAGFSLFTNGLYEPGIRQAYLLQMVIAATFVLSALGFSTIQDMFSPKNLRDRLAHPWKSWRLSTRISVNVAAFLLVLGTIGFYLLEQNHALAGLNLSESVVASFFQSATTRTAGFNTVDFAGLATPTLIMMIFLMFIGGGSGSPAGGIKTSTFYIIVASVLATSRGKAKLFVGNRFIPNNMVYKALSIFFYGVAVVLVGVFSLTVTEPETDSLDLAFEVVSAFGTVGLSTGVTGTLSAAGKVVIILCMFLGRVGTLTFAVALSRRVAKENFKLPRANLMVG